MRKSSSSWTWDRIIIPWRPKPKTMMMCRCWSCVANIIVMLRNLVKLVFIHQSTSLRYTLLISLSFHCGLLRRLMGPICGCRKLWAAASTTTYCPKRNEEERGVRKASLRRLGLSPKARWTDNELSSILIAIPLQLQIREKQVPLGFGEGSSSPNRDAWYQSRREEDRR